MKKTIYKICMLTILIIITINSYVQASMWTDAQQWLSIGQNSSTLNTNATTEVSNLAGVLFGIGIGVALIVVAALGISYLFASSAESKSDIKEKTIVVVIGIAILFGSLGIWRAVVGILSSGT